MFLLFMINDLKFVVEASFKNKHASVNIVYDYF